MAEPRFALNHMVAPKLDVAGLFALARNLGLHEVEIRNDIVGKATMDGTPAKDIANAATDAGVEIISINALQRFNDWTAGREAEAVALAGYAAECGARAIVLVPVNDGSGRANGERQGKLRVALKALKPILDSHGLSGLVECLGFESCSMRSKREVVDAMKAIDGLGTFRLVHDTFHHYVAGEPEIFPDLTGLVHVSGVRDSGIGRSEMRDAHRGLVDARDRLGNLAQMSALLAAGYDRPFSYEPFAQETHALADPASAIKECNDFIRSNLVGQSQQAVGT